jgi:hypothetical protein
MGGPSCGVLLPVERTAAVLAARRDLLAPVVIDWHEQRSDDPFTDGVVDFSVRTTGPIGGSYEPDHPGDNRLGLHVGVIVPGTDADADALPDDVDVIAPAAFDEIGRAFGCRPRSEVTLFSYVGRQSDHQLLGELAAYLCERMDGLIDFHGRLYGQPPPEVARTFGGAFERRMDQMYAYCGGVTRALPGVILTADGWDFGNATFLRAWLAHPMFRMVK